MAKRKRTGIGLEHLVYQEPVDDNMFFDKKISMDDAKKCTELARNFVKKIKWIMGTEIKTQQKPEYQKTQQ